MKNIILVFFAFIFFGYNLFSQNNDWYRTNDSFDDFHHQYIYYETSPKGLKNFIDKTEMEIKLKNELLSQVKKIKSKKTLGNIISYSTEAIGASFLLMSFVNETKYRNMRVPGFVIFAGGGITGMIIKPKKKDYLKFINTYNNQNRTNPIMISLNYNLNRKPNLGIVMNF